MDDSSLEKVFSFSEAGQPQDNMQAKLHVQKSSQGEMLLAFKLLVYATLMQLLQFW
jgi:hypothetical protein